MFIAGQSRHQNYATNLFSLLLSSILSSLCAICQLIAYFLLISHTSLASESEVPSPQQQLITPTILPRYSCREHLLNGHANSGVLPILSPFSGTIFWLECRFPPVSTSQSARLSVQTVVNNALVGKWLVADSIGELRTPTTDSREDIFVQQQITDRDFLHQLIMDSDECFQQIQIQWPAANETAGGNGSNTENILLETFDGQRLNFYRNFSVKAQYKEVLPIVGQSSQVRRIVMPLPKGTQLMLGPLICWQMLIPRAECHFELRTDSDQIRLKLPVLRRQSKATGNNIFSIAFRTSKPNGRLLELLDGGNGPLGALDLVDGYLLLSNHITHPVKLLADGLWHSIHLDMHSLSVRVDDLATSLSLRATADEEDQPQYLDILAHGELGALRLVSTIAGSQINGDGRLVEKMKDRSWICADRNDVLDVRQSVGQQYIFARPSVCSPSGSEKNFCNCQGPNSALAQNGGIGRQKITAQCAILPDQQNVFHLVRLADRLAFLLVPNFGPKAPISLIFKSEQPTGLLFFGTFSTLSSSASLAYSSSSAFSVFHAKTALGNGGRSTKSSSNGIEVLGGRVQAHFVGRTMYGAICMHLADGNEKCFSCSIQMDKDFVSTNSWTRVSLFYQLNYHFLSVNERVCLLSPNSHVVDPAEIYRISATNVLLVGGAFYTKHSLLSQRVNTQFRRDFQDNTREKAPSLTGCIGDILLRGQRQNLSHLLAAQIEQAKWNGPRKGEGPKAEHQLQQNDGSIFSINAGCPECPDKCNGAQCSRHFTSPSSDLQSQDASCQCFTIYASMSLSTGECQTGGQNRQMHAEHGSIAYLPRQQIEDQHVERRRALRLTVPADINDRESAQQQQMPPFSVLIRSPPSPTAWGRARNRLDRIWMLFRLPERNQQMHSFITVGGMHISIGEHGRKVVVEAMDYGLMEEFQLSSQLLDSRLHLLSIERNPVIGTSANGGAHLLIIRLDNVQRGVHLDEIPIGSIDGQPPKIEFRALILEGTEEDNEYELAANGGGDGCIQELIFHYALMDEELTAYYPNGGIGTASTANSQFQQINYINQFHQQFPFLLSSKYGCDNNYAGVRDPTLWFGNSSSWGRLSRNDEWQNGPMAFILRKTSSLARISLLVTYALILLILICLSFYMFYAIRRHYTDDQSSTSIDKCNGGTGKKHFDQMHATEHERRPLKLVMEGDETDNNNSYRKALNESAKEMGKMPPPPLPPKSPHTAAAVSNGWSNSRRTDEQQQQQHHYHQSSSPPTITAIHSSLHIASSNNTFASPNPPPPLRVTPLLIRSQPLRTSRNTIIQAQSSSLLATSTSPTTTADDPTQQQKRLNKQRREMSTEYMQIPSPIPPPSTIFGEQQQIEANNKCSSSGGSAGFFTPSPISSTTSPGSDNSSQGNNNQQQHQQQNPYSYSHQLMARPSLVRVAATSRQHSPIGGANGTAPIACKEEL